MDTSRWLLAALLFCGQMAHAEVSCFVVAQQPATILHDQQPKTPPLQLADCQGMRVLTGQVTVCYLQARGERTCRSLTEGAVFDVTDETTHAADFFSAFRATLARLLKGDNQSAIGQSRGNEMPLGLPHGNLLFNSAELVLEPEISHEAAWRLEIVPLGMAEQPSAVSVTAVAGRVTLPAAQFSRGMRYRWQLTGGAASYSGLFRVVSQPEVEEVEKRLSGMWAGQTPDPMSRTILTAEVLDELGYTFEAVEMLRRMSAW